MSYIPSEVSLDILHDSREELHVTTEIIYTQNMLHSVTQNIKFTKDGFFNEDQLLCLTQNKRNLVQTRPADFQPPLWRVHSSDILLGKFNIYIYINLRVLCGYVQTGQRFEGRYLLFHIFRSTLGRDSDNMHTLYNNNRHLLASNLACAFQNICTVRSQPTFEICNRNVPCDMHIKTHLFDFQNTSVTRMIELEDDQTELQMIPCKYTRLSAGVHEMWLHEKDTLHLSGECDKLTLRFRGGFLTNKMGMGKTLTLISLCLNRPIEDNVAELRPRATLVMCPSHVVAHWVREIKKHTNAKCIGITMKQHLQKSSIADILQCQYDFVILSFNILCNAMFRYQMEYYSSLVYHRSDALRHDFKRLSDAKQAAHPFNPHLFNWGRVIIDEFHELGNNVYKNIEAYMSTLRADIKWLVSATPMVNPQLYRRFVPNLLFGPDMHNIAQLPVSTAVIKAIMASGVCIGKYDVHIPAVRQHVVFVDMTHSERIIYDTVRCEGRSQQLRVCAYPRLTGVLQQHNETVATIDEMQVIVYRHLENRIKESEKVILELQRRVDTSPPCILPRSREAQLSRELRQRLINQERVRQDLSSTLTYVQNTTHTECAICLSALQKPCTIKTCGHRLCYDCIIRCMQTSYNCPICRQTFAKQDLICLQTEGTDELLVRYGSKLYNLITCIKDSLHAKTLIFSQWDELLRDVGKCILHVSPSTNVLFCRGNVMQKKASIDKFCTLDTHNLLLLSTVNCASGCDLSCATRVILLDTIDHIGNFTNGVEQQAISRCHRIGQTVDVEVIRFICRNTIEEEIYLAYLQQHTN